MPNKKINPLDFKNDVAIGLKLPLNSDVGGFALNYVTEDQIHTNLKNLILTMRGERLMHPTYGSGLYSLLFEPAVEGNISSAALETIRQAASEWMPFVNIKDASVDFIDNTANILVSYEVKELDITKILDISVRI